MNQIKEQIAELLEGGHLWSVPPVRIVYGVKVADLKTLSDSHTRLREALEHYADKENWVCVSDECRDSPQCSHDKLIYVSGKRNGYDIAEAALKEGTE